MTVRRECGPQRKSRGTRVTCREPDFGRPRPDDGSSARRAPVVVERAPRPSAGSLRRRSSSTLCSSTTAPIWTAYPRTLEADLEMLDAAGTDLVFVPETSELYPDDPFSPCGDRSRPGAHARCSKASTARATSTGSPRS